MHFVIERFSDPASEKYIAGVGCTTAEKVDWTPTLRSSTTDRNGSSGTLGTKTLIVAALSTQALSGQ